MTVNLATISVINCTSNLTGESYQITVYNDNSAAISISKTNSLLETFRISDFVEFANLVNKVDFDASLQKHSNR